MADENTVALIAGGIVVVIFLISGIGGFALFKRRKKMIREIKEDEERLQVDLVEKSQPPSPSGFLK